MTLASPTSPPQSDRPPTRLTRSVKVPPRRHPSRYSRRTRRAAFAGSLVVLFGLIPVLVWFGTKAALDDRSGREVATATDPSAPGFQALVTPTPTLLLLDVDGERRLTAATLLAGGGQGTRGGAMFVPARLQVDPGAAAPRTLADVYTAGGAQATVSAVEQLFHLGIDSVAAADPARWAQLVAPVGSLSFQNSDDLQSPADESSVTFPAGPITLTPDEVGDYLEARNPGEDERAHLYRHELFWRAWLAAVARAGASAAAVPGETDSGLGAMVRTLAQGEVTYSTMPVQPVEGTATGREGPELAPAQAELPAALAAVVPFPRSGTPGDRVKVRLLDGTGDRQTALQAGSALVTAGAELTVFGNADRFDYEQTEVHYYSTALRPEAEALAKAVGAGEPILQGNQTDTVDVTVIIGHTFMPPGTTR